MYGPMNKMDYLLPQLEELRRDFSRSWRKVHRKASAKAVHDLRINARRLMATLDMMHDLSSDNGFSAKTRRLKKVLKRTSALRDIQVHLRNLPELPNVDLADFKHAL